MPLTYLFQKPSSYLAIFKGMQPVLLGERGKKTWKNLG
jgi:hypothetical protein